MADANLNPMEGVYREFEKIIKNLTIKYSNRAEEYETFEIKKAADEYIDAYYKRDDFYHYRNFSKKDFLSVGVLTPKLMENSPVSASKIPKEQQDQLLKIARTRVISNYEEQNDYYRMLNGYPSIHASELDFYYVTEEIEEVYGISRKIPIHLIQDYYNKLDPGEGDRLINILDGLGYIQDLYKAHPEDMYLNYIGSYRIPIHESRIAKNFQVLQLRNGNIKNIVYDTFISTYEQSRDYFMSAVYNAQYRSIIDFYDNFMAMCIMVMTINQMVMRQLKLELNRNFYDIYAIKMLYEAYGVPYDLSLDEETQQGIVQNLNLLINHKSTNRVIYDIADLLGFTNIKVYKYYLAKVRKYDGYGVPIVKYKEQFNSDTGEVETVPDYEAMYDLYFHKSELKEDDFIQTLDDQVNRSEYEEITSGDPFWWEDQSLQKRLWETEYNFVESKYLGLGISYRMTDIVFENILLFKMIISKHSDLKNVTVQLPKILENTPIPIFDCIILMICLLAKKHNLTGEIIAIPDQVVNVLDYMKNLEAGDEFLMNSFSFNFDYFSPDNEEGFKIVKKLESLLGEEDAAKFKSYISVLSVSSGATPQQKIIAFNQMYENIKNLEQLIMYCMSETHDRQTYETLKQFYHAAFYANEVRDVFTITTESTGERRTAFNYFEFLYHYNPKLYKAVFTADLEKQYESYLSQNGLLHKDFSYEEYLKKVENQEIKAHYDTLLQSTYEEDDQVNDIIYYYANHIISQLSTIIKNLNMMHMVNDTAGPLEELLIKMIRFFKSLTVDLVGIDVTYVFDIKSDNMIRLFDEVKSIKKIIEPEEKIKISYSDVVHLLSVLRSEPDELKLVDKLKYTATIWFNNREDVIHPKDRLHLMIKDIQVKDEYALSPYDTVPQVSVSYELEDRDGMQLKDQAVALSKAYISDVNGFRIKDDHIDHIEKELEIKEKKAMTLYDTIASSTTYMVEERKGVKLRDKVFKKWYSD